MRIAVPFEGREIFPHFGKTQSFRFYDVDGKTITSSQTIGTDGKGHGQLAPFLKAQGTDAVICGGIGAGMQEALSLLGIKFYAGVSGSPDEAVNAFLAGTLEYTTEANCSHEGGNNHHGM